MSAFGWQRRLDDSSTPQEVVEVANDFLALWTSEELAQLPLDCLPDPLAGAGQLNSYALKLAHRDTITTGAVSPLHRMATFFTKAALRLFQIEDTTHAEHGERRNKGERRGGGGGTAQQ